MALIKCPECGSQMSSEAAFCPQCGWPRRSKKQASPACLGCMTSFTILFFLSVFAGWMTNHTDLPAAAQSQPANPIVEKPAPADIPQPVMPATALVPVQKEPEPLPPVTIDPVLLSKGEALYPALLTRARKQEPAAGAPASTVRDPPSR
jgi:hypothetical protein